MSRRRSFHLPTRHVRATCLIWVLSCTHGPTATPSTPVSVVPAEPAGQAALQTESRQELSPAGASPQPAPSAPNAEPAEAAAYWVEVAEADTVRVHTVDAITIEADEIRCEHVQRVDYFPTPKDMRFVRLEGQLIAGHSLVAHHVRARLLIADEITAHKIGKLRTPLSRSVANEAAPAQTRCSDREGNPARCTLDAAP